MLYFMEDLSGKVANWTEDMVPMSPWTVSEDLQKQSSLNCFVKVRPSETKLAEYYKVKAFPTCVFLDQYGNEYTRVVKRLSLDGILGALNAYEYWSTPRLAKLDKAYEKFQNYEFPEDETKKDRAAAMRALDDVVNNRDGLVGYPVIEKAQEQWDTLIGEGMAELESLVKNCTTENLEETLGKIGDLKKTYGASSDFKDAADAAIKQCKKEYSAE